MIAIEGISQIFATSFGTVRALQDVSFDVQPNEFVTLVGRSGCGTRLPGHLRLLAPTEGTVKINGEPVTPLDATSVSCFRSPLCYPGAASWRNSARRGSFEAG